MAMSDSQFRIGVLAGGAAVVALIAYLRFFGAVSLPAKPAPPTGPTGTDRQLLSSSLASPGIYKDFLRRDAALAGVPVPTIAQMSRKLAYHVDEPADGIALVPGGTPVTLAGLRLHVERNRGTIVLVIQNLLDADVAYHVVTRPSIDPSQCDAAPALSFDAMVITEGGSETRTECVWRHGESILVKKAETLEVPPLSSWYLSQLPPSLVGIEARIARGDRASQRSGCSPIMRAIVKNGLDRGQLTWRDLVDFYARHRCQTYKFPMSYRAFNVDNARPLPAVGG